MIDSYLISHPLIKRSKLACREKGGKGKALSEGWALNFAIGCLHGCQFCYVDSIHRRYRGKRMGFQHKRWGDYFFIPENISEAIERTPWSRWSGREVMMSSTHDPYLPRLLPITEKILNEALPAGIRFCIQTRSPLILEHMDLLEKYRDQIRIQVSVATLDEKLHRLVEPRIVHPGIRMKILKEAKRRKITSGIIVAPVFPPCRVRPDWRSDLDNIFLDLNRIGPEKIYGEMLHCRGSNLSHLREDLGMDISRKQLIELDPVVGDYFEYLLEKHNLEGTWWPEK